MIGRLKAALHILFRRPLKGDIKSYVVKSIKDFEAMVNILAYDNNLESYEVIGFPDRFPAYVHPVPHYLNSRISNIELAFTYHEQAKELIAEIQKDMR